MQQSAPPASCLKLAPSSRQLSEFHVPSALFQGDSLSFLQSTEEGEVSPLCTLLSSATLSLNGPKSKEHLSFPRRPPGTPHFQHVAVLPSALGHHSRTLKCLSSFLTEHSLMGHAIIWPGFPGPMVFPAAAMGQTVASRGLDPISAMNLGALPSTRQPSEPRREMWGVEIQ